MHKNSYSYLNSLFLTIKFKRGLVRLNDAKIQQLIELKTWLDKKGTQEILFGLNSD